MELDFTSALPILERIGWPGLICLTLLILIWKHGPSLIKSQVALTNSSAEYLPKFAESLEKLTELAERNRTTDHALKHLGRAVQAHAESTNDQAGRAVQPHTTAIEDLFSQK